MITDIGQMLLNIGQPQVTNKSNILDIQIPEQMERAVATGHPHIDLLFAGDGVVPGTTALVTGLPGTGKSTLMIEMADRVSSTGNLCLYNTGEESLYQIRRVAGRLRLRNGFIPSYHRCVDDLIAQTTSLMEENKDKQVFVIQDSLQCLEPSKINRVTGEKAKGRPLSGLNAQVSATVNLVEFVKNNFGILMVIGQVTKGGDFAGRQTIKHLMDCHLHLGIDTDKKSETYGQRVAEMRKNRFGVAGFFFGFEIEETGVRFEQAT